MVMTAGCVNQVPCTCHQLYRSPLTKRMRTVIGRGHSLTTTLTYSCSPGQVNGLTAHKPKRSFCCKHVMHCTTSVPGTCLWQPLKPAVCGQLTLLTVDRTASMKEFKWYLHQSLCKTYVRASHQHRHANPPYFPTLLLTH